MVENNTGWFASASGILRHLFRRKRPEQPLEKPNPDLMIVRRGLSDAFYFYCHVFAKEHGLKVIPDRRTHERRRWQRATPTIDRRQIDRRAGQTKWSADDFIIVPDPRKAPRGPVN